MRLAISLSSVLLPQPDGPIRVRNSPSAIARSIGASPRAPLAKTFSADSTSTAGGPSALAICIGFSPAGSRGNSILMSPLLVHADLQILDETIVERAMPVDLRIDQAARHQKIVDLLVAIGRD